MDSWWSGFRRWPWWAQALAWVLVWPGPLVLLAVADPQRRRMWGGTAAATSLVWVALVADAARAPEPVEASAEVTTTTTAERTSTTREHIAPTTTEPASLGPVPDPSALVPGVATEPVRTGGLTTTGAGVLDVDALLARLTVAPESSASRYDRSLFGSWTDDDDDGCDTRSEVLEAESMSPVEKTSGCRVLTGSWLSIYDGYSTPDATELEIDHLVALHEAWKSGASTWGPERRRAFANDLGHPGALVAVTAAMNRSKSDKDPAVWQPPNRAAWCIYAADWITVKARWGLSADQAEAKALRNMLAGCGSAPTTTTTAAPPPPPPVPPTTASARGGCDPSYPDVCIPPAPPDLDCPDIPYRRFRVIGIDPHRFDADHDGIGCESG